MVLHTFSTFSSMGSCEIFRLIHIHSHFPLLSIFIFWLLASVLVPLPSPSPDAARLLSSSFSQSQSANSCYTCCSLPVQLICELCECPLYSEPEPYFTFFFTLSLHPPLLVKQSSSSLVSIVLYKKEN